MSDYTRGVLRVFAVIFAAVALWALVVAVGYVLIDGVLLRPTAERPGTQADGTHRPVAGGGPTLPGVAAPPSPQSGPPCRAGRTTTTEVTRRDHHKV